MIGLALATLAAATVMVAAPSEAAAQELQLTGPLAGAPAVRRLRLHREERFDIAPTVSFTLLDEYRRSILPGIRGTYHFFDWFGVGLFAAGGVQYNTGLSDELQDKAINQRNCVNNPNSLECKRTAVSLCRAGEDCLADNQLGRLTWVLAPQLTFVPFRGKVSFLSLAFVDTDISLFVGGAIVGLQERKSCTKGTCANPGSFELEHRVTGAPTFGLGFNFYPHEFVSFGAEFRGLPLVWNTSGFDVAGADEDFPDDVVDGDDREFHFNSMISLYVGFQLPTEMKISD